MGERTIRTWRSTSNKTTAYYANSSNAGGATTTTESYAKPFIFFGAGWVKETRRMSSGTMAMAVARAIAMVTTTFGKSSNKMGPVSSRIPVCIAIAVRNTISNHTVRIPNAARYTNNARHFAYKIGKYINLLERSRVDAARLRDEVLWAGLLPSCMTLLDWGRLN